MSERLDRVETDIEEIRAVLREVATAQSYNQQQISDLKSSISTLAEIVGIHDRQIEESQQRFDRQIGQLVQSQQEFQQRFEESNRRFEESQQRFDRYIEQAERDRALMLRLIESIAQGRNGG